MPRGESDCSQDLQETRFFPGLFLIDASVYWAFAARLLPAVQPRVITQFWRLIKRSHRVQVWENCRLCHGGRSCVLLDSGVCNSHPQCSGCAHWDFPFQQPAAGWPWICTWFCSSGLCLILRILVLLRDTNFALSSVPEILKSTHLTPVQLSQWTLPPDNRE